METFIQSIELLILGMGATFVFLILLVCVTKLLSAFVVFINKYSPEKAAQTQVAIPAGCSPKAALAIALAKHHSK